MGLEECHDEWRKPGFGISRAVICSLGRLQAVEDAFLKPLSEEHVSTRAIFYGNRDVIWTVSWWQSPINLRPLVVRLTDKPSLARTTASDPETGRFMFMSLHTPQPPYDSRYSAL